MARERNKLAKVEVASAKPSKKVINLADGGGLILQVQPSGGRGADVY